MKCLDCGYNINEDEIELYHEGHDIVEGFFEDGNDEDDDYGKAIEIGMPRHDEVN